MLKGEHFNMIRSMTGFGSASGEFAGRTLTVEIKSVNNRFREVVTRMPKICAPLEDSIKKLVASRLERGRVDLWLQLDDREAKRRGLTIDLEYAYEVKGLLTQLKDHLDLNDSITLDHILAHGVIGQSDDSPALEELWTAVSPLVEEALTALVTMREAEGANLIHDLEKRLARLLAANRKVEELASSAPDMLLEKLKNRLSELGAGVKVDQTRLAQEAALLADRADITEEVVRLNSHIARFQSILSDNEAAGRRLDFLLQEMGREVNTMGSKAQDLEVTGLVLDMKAELEKLREQVQNIE
ncbi:YicC family protein [Deltaproteobacteria bacterium Smac51]|nr:YicC family protein [Deltaproteobacteria bacterium Smac51]